jgi:hypothetical protein
MMENHWRDFIRKTCENEKIKYLLKYLHIFIRSMILSLIYSYIVNQEAKLKLARSADV